MVTCGNRGAGGQQTARVAERDSAMEREGMVGRVEGCFCSGGGGKCGYLTRIAIHQRERKSHFPLPFRVAPGSMNHEGVKLGRGQSR